MGAMAHRLFVLLIVVAATLQSGCTPTIKVYPVTPPKDVETIRQAGDVAGIRTRVVHEPGWGVVELKFRGHAGDVCGRALEQVVRTDINEILDNGLPNCQPKAWSCEDVTFLAHELGHTIGALRHVKQNDPKSQGNIMRPEPDKGDQFNRYQKRRMKVMGNLFNSYCRQTRPTTEDRPEAEQDPPQATPEDSGT